jgi:hypothetical protein
MKRALLTLPLAAIALPAQAADRDLARAAAQLEDPRTQDALAETLSALVASMLDIKVGGIANAVAKADPKGRIREVDPEMTVRDMAERDNPDFADDLDADVRSGTRMAGALAGAMAAMLPQLEALARDVEERVADAKDRARR